MKRSLITLGLLAAVSLAACSGGSSNGGSAGGPAPAPNPPAAPASQELAVFARAEMGEAEDSTPRALNDIELTSSEDSSRATSMLGSSSGRRWRRAGAAALSITVRWRRARGAGRARSPGEVLERLPARDGAEWDAIRELNAELAARPDDAATAAALARRYPWS